MPTLYEDYLSGIGDTNNQTSNLYQSYLDATTERPSLYDEYRASLYGYPSLTDEEKARDVAITGRELLEEHESPGFAGALWSGLKSGATLGWAADEPVSPESMTFGETAAELVGELAGGLGPLLTASYFTGGAGAPVAGVKYATNVYSAFRRLSRATKVAKKYSKYMGDIAKQASTIGMKTDDLLKGGTGLRGQLSKQYIKAKSSFDLNAQRTMVAESVIKEAQKKYVEGLMNKGAKKQASRISKMVSKTGTGYITPRPYGKILGNSQLYKKKVIEPLAKKYGYKGAAIADRFANSAIAFASVGLVANKPGASLVDRARDVPRDAFMGMMFAAAGSPTLAGKAWGPKMEPIALMALGGYPDYLTADPDPNMDMRDRLLHGLSLIAFHYAGHGLSNIGIKDKMFKGLIDMNFDEPIAFEMAYNTKFANKSVSHARDWYQRTGTLYHNKKSPSEVISISEFKSKSGVEGAEEPGFIRYMHLGSEETGTFTGKSLSEARKKLKAKYKKVDFKNEKLLDDLPPEVRENVDSMMEGLQTDWVELGGMPLPGGGKPKKTWKIAGPAEEPLGKDIPQYEPKQRQEAKFYESQRKDLEKVATKNRTFDSERDVKEIVPKDAYQKGDLVEWVKFEGEKPKSEPLTEAIFDKFVKEGVVSKEILQGISDKIVNNEKLSKQEQSIYQNKSKQIESLIKEIKEKTKEMLVDKDGAFYPIKVEKVDANYVHINLRGSTVSEGISKQLQMEGNKIPISEVKMIRPYGKRVPQYKLSLRYSSREDGKNYRTIKDTSWDDPNTLFFESREAAERYARENWVGKWEANDVIKSKINFLSAKEKRITSRQEFQNFGREADQLNRAFKSKEFNADEQAEVLRIMFPESNGNVYKMTRRQVRRVTDLIKGDESISFDVFDRRIPLPPENFVDKVSPRFGKFLKMAGTKIKETFLGTGAIGEMLGGYGAEMSFAEKQHARWRNTFMGLTVNLHNGLRRDLKGTGVSMRKVNDNIQAFLDPETFGGQLKSKESKLFAEKLEKITLLDSQGREVNGLEAIKDRYKKFYDEAALAQISSDSYIRDTSTKTLQRVPFVKIYDKRGNKIKLADINKDFELHSEQLNSILSWMKGEPKKYAGKPVIKNEHGNFVPIDTKRSKHHYVKNYSRKQITNEFFDFINVPDGVGLKRAAAYMATNDPELLKLNNFDKAFARATQLIKDIQQINSQKNIYGQQYTRVADLPAYIYISKGKGGWGDIVPMDKVNVFKENGKPYEIGESIIDANGGKHQIAKRIKVYESDYIPLIDNYTSGLAHSTATYSAYGKNGDINPTISNISNGLAAQTGDLYYGKWAKKIMESQVYGEKQSTFSKLMRPITRWSAISGLSSPLSGFKNLLLGNVQNVTVFTGRELWKTYLSRDSGLLNPTGGLRTKWKDARDYSERIGATYQSSFDLYLETSAMSGWMKRWLPNLGLMRTTEILNRTVSQAIGPFAMDIHIANMAMKKNPATRGVSVNDSRRILRDVLEFTPEQIGSMIDRYRTKRANYIKLESKKEGGDVNGKAFKFEFNEIELKQAAQQAHTITQGSGDLPYIPYWMGKGWAKPLTLFYRVAYRITDSVAKNVVKPVIVDGNMVPAMKHIGASVAAGKTLYAAYDYIFDEERVNKFKDTPSQWFDYFIKSEGLALFSNAYNEYGGWEESYFPVPLRNITTVWDNLVDFGQGKKHGTTALGDGMKEIVALYGTAERYIKQFTKENVKQYDDSKRRQYQFLDTYYPKEQINLDYEDGINAKTPYYKALRDVFWHDDLSTIAKTYYTSLAFLSHRIMSEKGITNYRMAEKEARERLKRTISSLEPIPKSWKKTMGRTGKSRYIEYINSLSPEDREREENIMSLYREKQRNFINAISTYKNNFYKTG